jgi:hypothetical protein
MSILRRWGAVLRLLLPAATLGCAAAEAAAAIEARLCGIPLLHAAGAPHPPASACSASANLLRLLLLPIKADGLHRPDWLGCSGGRPPPSPPPTPPHPTPHTHTTCSLTHTAFRLDPLQW